MKGFTLWFGNKDYFLVTERKNVTDKLAEIVLDEIGVRFCRESVEEIKRRLRPAECEIVTCTVGDYYEIHGDGFGGKGSFVDDGNTIIIDGTGK